MAASRKAIKKAHKHHLTHHVIATVKPEHVPVLTDKFDTLTLPGALPGASSEVPNHVADEDHVVAAVPKSVWTKFTDWLAKEFK